MLGNQSGCLVSQGEILAGLLRQEGYSVTTISSVPNRCLRLFDTVYRLLTDRKKIDILCIQVYSGPSFVIADIASGIGKFLRFRVIMHLHGGNIPDLSLLTASIKISFPSLAS